MFKSPDGRVRIAATAAIGSLGDARDVPRLAGLCDRRRAGSGGRPGRLVHLAGREVDAAIADEVPKAKPGVRVELIGVLVSRHATGTASIGTLWATACGSPTPTCGRPQYAAQGAGPVGRAGGSAEPAQTRASRPQGASPRGRREGGDVVCRAGLPIPSSGRPRFWPLCPTAMTRSRLPCCPRWGEWAATRRKLVEAAMADADPERHAAGLRALCNWPDASVAGRLLGLAQTAAVPAKHDMARAALIRVAPLPDKRPQRPRSWRCSRRP